MILNGEGGIFSFCFYTKRVYRFENFVTNKKITIFATSNQNYNQSNFLNTVTARIWPCCAYFCANISLAEHDFHAQ
jgi:hypothetical protein